MAVKTHRLSSLFSATSSQCVCAWSIRVRTHTHTTHELSTHILCAGICSECCRCAATSKSNAGVHCLLLLLHHTLQRSSHGGLDVDDSIRHVVHAECLAGAGRLQVRERWEEELPLAGERREEGEVGATRHEVLGEDAEEERILGERVLHRDLQLRGGGHGREFRAALALLKEAALELHVLHATVEGHHLVGFLFFRRHSSQEAERLTNEGDGDREGV
mmetsp:Transcript_61206/g.121143  ORF Transcript_61206/g.121143 Transcript_61206/m.121143 type:complete len:218 (-) Transcript_61206:1019-1672(-)